MRFKRIISTAAGFSTVAISTSFLYSAIIPKSHLHITDICAIKHYTVGKSLLHCALSRLTLCSLEPYTVLYFKKTVGFLRIILGALKIPLPKR